MCCTYFTILVDNLILDTVLLIAIVTTIAILITLLSHYTDNYGSPRKLVL